MPDYASQVPVKYIRVSHLKQEPAYSLDSQNRVLDEWAVNLGFQIPPGGLHTYKDVQSAKSGSERKEFDAMVEDAKKKKFHAILTFNHDRFARDVKTLLNVVDELVEYGVFLYCYDLPGINLYDPIGRSQLITMANMSEFFGHQHGAKVRAGLKQKMWNKEWVGKAPYGYHAISDDVEIHGRVFHQNTRLIEVPNEQKVIEKVWEYRKKGLTPGEIAWKLLYEEKVLPRTAKKWSGSTIASILRNQKNIEKRGPI